MAGDYGRSRITCTASGVQAVQATTAQRQPSSRPMMLAWQKIWRRSSRYLRRCGLPQQQAWALCMHTCKQHIWSLHRSEKRRCATGYATHLVPETATSVLLLLLLLFLLLASRMPTKRFRPGLRIWLGPTDTASGEAAMVCGRMSRENSALTCQCAPCGRSALPAMQTSACHCMT